MRFGEPSTQRAQPGGSGAAQEQDESEPDRRRAAERAQQAVESSRDELFGGFHSDEHEACRKRDDRNGSPADVREKPARKRRERRQTGSREVNDIEESRAQTGRETGETERKNRPVTVAAVISAEQPGHVPQVDRGMSGKRNGKRCRQNAGRSDARGESMRHAGFTSRAFERIPADRSNRESQVARWNGPVSALRKSPASPAKRIEPDITSGDHQMPPIVTARAASIAVQ